MQDNMDAPDGVDLDGDLDMERDGEDEGDKEESDDKEEHDLAENEEEEYMGNNISKKIFCPGGMALSEWTRSVRAVRDIPVTEHSAPGGQYHASRCISPSDRRFNVSSRSVGLLF